RAKNSVDGRRGFVGVDCDNRSITDQEARISATDTVRPVRIKTLATDRSRSVISGKALFKLRLKCASPAPPIVGCRKTFAGIQRENIGFRSQPLAGSDTNDVRSKPLQTLDPAYPLA